MLNKNHALLLAGLLAVTSAIAVATERSAIQVTGSRNTSELSSKDTNLNRYLDTSDSIPGPDNNRNGVRDDVEYYLSRAGYSDQQRAALTRYSKALTSAMSAPHTSGAMVISAFSRIQETYACLTVKGLFNNATEAGADASRATVNTHQRYQAYKLFQEWSEALAVKVPRTRTCEHFN